MVRRKYLSEVCKASSCSDRSQIKSNDLIVHTFAVDYVEA